MTRPPRRRWAVGGYHPVANLVHYARGRMTDDRDDAAFKVAELPAHMFAAGSVNGVYDPGSAVADGRQPGWAAAGDAGRDVGASLL